MEFVDFDKCRTLDSPYYGGHAGRKIAVVYKDQVWLLKFPESTKEFRGNIQGKHNMPSYTTSPLSEYIGSKIYAALDIPVHETVLGQRDGKVVVGCKDFATTSRLWEFVAIKNSVDEDSLEHGNSSSDRGEYLSEVMRVLDCAEAFEGLRDEAKTRFWDMFVVDAYILNNDRNNGNWGLLTTFSPFYKKELAPVYDNGNAFFNKKSPSLMATQVDDNKAVLNDVKASTSFYLDDEGEHIHPFKYIASHQNKDCDAALRRFCEKADLRTFEAIVDEIPDNIIGSVRKEYYKKLLLLSLEQGIKPACRSLGKKNKEDRSLE